MLIKAGNDFETLKRFQKFCWSKDIEALLHQSDALCSLNWIGFSAGCQKPQRELSAKNVDKKILVTVQLHLIGSWPALNMKINNIWFQMFFPKRCAYKWRQFKFRIFLVDFQFYGMILNLYSDQV